MSSCVLRAAVVSLLLFVAGAPCLHAADGPASPGEVVEISFEEGVSVQSLLIQAAKRSGRTILWNEQDKNIQKKLVGAHALRVPVADLMDAVADLLASQEVLLVPVGSDRAGTLMAMDARQLQNQFILRNRAMPVVMDDATAAKLEGRNGLFLATTLAVPGAGELREVRAALARFATPNQVGSVHEISGSRVIAVSDFAPNVVAMYRFVKTLPVTAYPPVPVPQPAPSPGVPQAAQPTVATDTGGRVEFFALRHARAAEVHRMLGELLGPRGADAANALPRFSIDAVGNQVSMFGTDLQIERARTIVARFDVERPTGSR